MVSTIVPRVFHQRNKAIWPMGPFWAIFNGPCPKLLSCLVLSSNQAMEIRYQCEAPKIAFSWFISGVTMVYGRYNYS